MLYEPRRAGKLLAKELGGEILHDISMDEDYAADPATVLRDAVMCGEGPLCRHLHTEEEQRTYDATCRKLDRFLEKLLPRGV